MPKGTEVASLTQKSVNLWPKIMPMIKWLDGHIERKASRSAKMSRKTLRTPSLEPMCCRSVLKSVRREIASDSRDISKSKLFVEDILLILFK
uniref:Uncharacterized protein n=1 Tax=Trichuris muris TaxID=70415 RepID=A0A5S6R1Q4_TRIMR